MLAIPMSVLAHRIDGARAMRARTRKSPYGSLLFFVSMLGLCLNRATAAFWATNGTPPVSTAYGAATLLPNGKVLLVGGSSSNGVVNTAALYDPSTGRWTATTPISYIVEDQTATFLPNGQVLVAGGDDGTNFFGKAALYDPATRTWTAIGGLNNARGIHSATLLTNGTVLVAGGFGTNNRPVKVQLLVAGS